MRRLFRVGMLFGPAGRNSGCEPHYNIKKSILVLGSSCESDQAQCLEDLRVADVFGL